jgi:sugar phosphate isomerase/epimerase
MKLPDVVFDRPALTTRFAAASRVLSPDAILSLAERAGASQLVLDASLTRDLVEPLQAALERARDRVTVLAMEAPCPRSVRFDRREPELCAPERDEADAALQAAAATVRRAGELRARFVIVSLGEVRPIARDWTVARDRFLRGELDDWRVQQMSFARRDAAERALDQARRALERLAREAERAGVTLAVRNPRRYVELPSPRELDLLRDDLSGAPIAPMLDAAHAHLTDVMGFVPLPATLAAWGKPALCYFGDACGPIGALPPGRGVLELGAVMGALGEATATAFDPWSGLTLDEIADGLPLVARRLAQS